MNPFTLFLAAGTLAFSGAGDQQHSAASSMIPSPGCMTATAPVLVIEKTYTVAPGSREAVGPSWRENGLRYEYELLTSFPLLPNGTKRIELIGAGDFGRPVNYFLRNNTKDETLTVRVRIEGYLK